MQEEMGAHPGGFLGAAEPPFWWPAEGCPVALRSGEMGVKLPGRIQVIESYEREEPGMDSPK